jgi:hypothetical protein
MARGSEPGPSTLFPGGDRSMQKRNLHIQANLQINPPVMSGLRNRARNNPLSWKTLAFSGTPGGYTAAFRLLSTSNKSMSLATRFLLALTFAIPFAASAHAQQGFGKLDPAPPTGATVDEIIAKFGAREADFAAARDNYTFRQTVKVDTLDADTNKVDGEYQQITDIVFTPEGKREEHVVFAPQNTLERVMMSPTDFDEIEHRLPFILTTDDLPHYDVKYVGRQKVDDLDTYVFDAGPRVIEKNHHYFQGRVWVDQQEFEIVLVNGTTVPQDTRKGHEDLQPPFTTYYEQVDGKNWFPTYTKAEGVLHFQAQNGALSEDVHMRSIVKFTDYKQFRATSRIIYNGEDITNKKAPDATPPPPAKPAGTPPK